MPTPITKASGRIAVSKGTSRIFAQTTSSKPSKAHVLAIAGTDGRRITLGRTALSCRDSKTAAEVVTTMEAMVADILATPEPAIPEPAIREPALGLRIKEVSQGSRLNQNS